MVYSTRNSINEQQPNNTNQRTVTAQFADNRPSTAKQQKQQSLMAARPNATAQRIAPEEELQIKSTHSTAQLVGMDEEELLQSKFEPAQRAEKPNNTGLPNQLKAGVENLSGMSMDHVNVHLIQRAPTTPVTQLGGGKGGGHQQTKGGLQSHKNQMKFVKGYQVQTNNPVKKKSARAERREAHPRASPGGASSLSAGLGILLAMLILSGHFVQAAAAQQQRGGGRGQAGGRGRDSASGERSLALTSYGNSTSLSRGDTPVMDSFSSHSFNHSPLTLINQPGGNPYTRSTRTDPESWRPMNFATQEREQFGDFSEPNAPRLATPEPEAEIIPAQYPRLANFIFGLRRNLHELNAIPRDDLSLTQWVINAPAWVYLPYIKVSPTELYVTAKHFYNDIQQGIQAYHLAKEARDFRRDLFQVDTDKPISGLVQKNALRHSYWTCRLTQEFGASFAKDISDAHEDAHVDLTIEGPYDHVTDRINNMIGIQLAQFLDGNCGDWVQTLWNNGTLAYAASFRVDPASGRQTADVNYQQPLKYLVQIHGVIPDFSAMELSTLKQHNVTT